MITEKLSKLAVAGSVLLPISAIITYFVVLYEIYQQLAMYVPEYGFPAMAIAFIVIALLLVYVMYILIVLVGIIVACILTLAGTLWG